MLTLTDMKIWIAMHKTQGYLINAALLNINFLVSMEMAQFLTNLTSSIWEPISKPIFFLEFKICFPM